MSKMDGLNLQNLVYGYSSLLNLKSILSLIYQAALILEDIQRHELVYCDAKPANFILNSYGQLGIIDFGSTRYINEKHCINIYTRHYAAPEQIANEPEVPDFSYDVYSLGIMLLDFLNYYNRYGDEYYEEYRSMIDKVCSRMTSKNRRSRYNNISEVVAALEMIVPDDYIFVLRELANTINTRDNTNLGYELRSEDITAAESSYWNITKAGPVDFNESTYMTAMGFEHVFPKGVV